MAYTTIKKPSDYFNTLLYSGNNTAQRQLTGVGFQPDLVWIKGRSGTYGAYSHFVFDGVRGVGKQIHTNLTNAESTNLNNLYSFDSDGFSLGQSGVDAVTNGSSTEFVSWNWLGANGTASNTQGDIASTVSANTTSGFSIVSYTGTGANATVGHGLGVAPKMVIIKDRDASTDWVVYHNSLGATKFIEINTTVAAQTNNTAWNDTEPTSSVFSIGTGGIVNTSSNDYIAYCFAEKKGFSKFGSYAGNGNADGPFIYTGFKPAFVMVKPTVTADNWVMFDNKRLGYNPDNNFSYANKEFVENDSDIIDFTSNGFKQRSSGGTSNRSGEPFIYMAFAEEPLVGDNPATAR